MKNVTSKNNPTQSPLSELTNNLIPFSTLSNLCNVPLKQNPKNAPPDSSPVSGKENRSQNALSHFSNSTTTPSRRVAPPPTPPLGTPLFSI
ncbi:hypothetical protein LIER_40964 [Lithospermum erythrorhizon]|uniref:Uncharacterized protein n=1 Tax=Lithospermum erythrorhizon TaxID=34254 RepID=A0AAV3R296_LITER